MEKEFDLNNVNPGSFRQKIKAGLIKLNKQFFPDGDDRPGKFDKDVTMVAYQNDDKSFILIDGN